jgi:hypothetical protein
MKMSKEYAKEHKRKQRLNPVFKETELERNRAWAALNADKISQQKKEYYLANKEELKKAKRQQYVERRTRIVSWDAELTSLVYDEAYDLIEKRNKITGIQWSVDHIIPIKGKTVSGLDVWNNLQVIPLSENKRKHNSYEDCP